jgi:hypothetical protein
MLLLIRKRTLRKLFYERIVALNTRQAELMLLKEDPELWNRIKFWIADIDRSGNITTRMQKCDCRLNPTLRQKAPSSSIKSIPLYPK